MMDRGLAELYGVRTEVLNQAVRRHRDRFPKDFMLQLTAEETVGVYRAGHGHAVEYSQ